MKDKPGSFLCENLYEKNFPKPARTGKNRERSGKNNFVNSNRYNDIRRLGSSGFLSLNQLAETSSLSRPTSNINGVQRVVASMHYHALSAFKSAVHKPYM
jgi:hypothetical protein